MHTRPVVRHKRRRALLYSSLMFLAAHCWGFEPLRVTDNLLRIVHMCLGRTRSGRRERRRGWQRTTGGSGIPGTTWRARRTRPTGGCSSMLFQNWHPCLNFLMCRVNQERLVSQAQEVTEVHPVYQALGVNRALQENQDLRYSCPPGVCCTNPVQCCF